MQPATDLNTAMSTLSNGGYCLWVGAGVATHLVGAGSGTDLGWKALTESLEREASLEAPQFAADYSSRLQVCLSVLGRDRFQVALRGQIYNVLRDQIIAAIEKRLNFDDPVPKEFRQLSRLGTLAAAIINFNVETWTSHCIASGGWPYQIKSFRTVEVKELTSVLERHGPITTRFARSVFHPHGAIDISGPCVLTSTDYRRLSGHLAYQLAVHQAFELDLAIVGMSLDDVYLRQQITDFRDQLGRVLWFTNRHLDPLKPIKEWAWANQIEVVAVDDAWGDFWQAVDNSLPPGDEASIIPTWSLLVMKAYREKRGGGSFSQWATLHQQHFGPGPTLDNLRRMARLSGEPPMDQEITLTETEQRVYAYLVKYWGRT